MIDGYKELTPVIYGENAIKYLYTEQKKAEGEICFLLHWHDRMELTYVTEGTLRFVTEGEEFLVSAGELAVAGPGQMHGGFAVSEKVCYHTVMFDVERFYNGTAASEKYLRSLGNGELTFVEKIAGKEVSGLLERLVELAEEYIDAECKTEEKRQYFSFDSKFERLAYRRVEKDPRELVQVEVPFDRLYSDMAFAYIRQQDYVSARNALMQAVRWDPMNCNYRLDLAELFRALEDKQEWASLSFSVLERASDGKCAARAYANLGQYFLEPETENVSAAVGCARLALRLAPNDAHTTRLLNKIHTTYPDAADESDDHVMGELALQGVPTSPSAEIAICLIMCATDAASDGDKQEATRLTVRARDLVGEEACAAIIKLVRESDAELNAERKAKRETAGLNADGAKEAGDAQ